MEKPPTIITPNGPALDIVKILHRGNDGLIKFAKKNSEGKLIQLKSLYAKSIDNGFLRLSEQYDIDTDSYFTPIAFFKHQRKASDARYITSCWIDIDCHDDNGQPVDDIATEAMRQISDGLAPMPSILKFSGRGIWFFWMLRDANRPMSPPGAFGENIRAFRHIQLALLHRFAKSGSDRNAIDLARLTRIDGSLNSEAGRRVGYQVFTDGDGQIYSYTFKEMAEALGVDISRKLYGKAWTHGSAYPDRTQQGKDGYQKLWRLRLDTLDTLRVLRSGWRKGHRYRALAFTAQAMRNVGCSMDEIREVIYTHASECLTANGDPLPLESEDIEAAIDFRQARVRNQYMADVLSITAEEAQNVYLPPASRYADVVPLPPTRKEKQQRRREFLLNLGKRITVREAIRLYEDELGYMRVSSKTAADDINATWGKAPVKDRQKSTVF